MAAVVAAASAVAGLCHRPRLSTIPLCVLPFFFAGGRFNVWEMLRGTVITSFCRNHADGFSGLFAHSNSFLAVCRGNVGWFAHRRVAAVEALEPFTALGATAASPPRAATPPPSPRPRGVTAIMILLLLFFSSSLTPRSLLPPPPPPLHHLLHTKRPQFIFLLSVRDGHCFHWREGAREISSSIFSCRAVSPSLSSSQSHGSGQNLDDYDDSDDDDAVDRDPGGVINWSAIDDAPRSPRSLAAAPRAF